MKSGLIWKMVGETPLQALSRFRAAHNLDAAVPLTYAGRLDPMADGVLLVLVGDECKKAKEYYGLEKEYVVEIVLGINTDSGDVLGLPQVHHIQLHSLRDVQNAVAQLVGNHAWPYPRYSSKTVDGVPLHAHTRAGEDPQLPMQRADIRSLSIVTTREVSSRELLAEILQRLQSLTTEGFRTAEIVRVWGEVLKNDTKVQCVTVRCICGSGTYMRTLAEKFGKMLNTTGCALSITRTRVGNDTMPAYGTHI